MGKQHLIRSAQPDDVDNLVWLQHQLFVQDAGVYGTQVDLHWPQREGSADLHDLLEAERSLVLIATEAAGPNSAVGYLVGYVSSPTPTRMPVDIAILRSLFVAAERRGGGIGSDLCSAFLRWAEVQGCSEAQVSAYAKNEGAQRFYERHGFVAQSISRSRPLGP